MQKGKISNCNFVDFSNKVLGMTAGIEDLGGFKWDLLGTFCVTWTLVFLCLCKGRLDPIHMDLNKYLFSLNLL